MVRKGGAVGSVIGRLLQAPASHAPQQRTPERDRLQRTDEQALTAISANGVPCSNHPEDDEQNLRAARHRVQVDGVERTSCGNRIPVVPAGTETRQPPQAEYAAELGVVAPKPRIEHL